MIPIGDGLGGNFAVDVGSGTMMEAHTLFTDICQEKTRLLGVFLDAIRVVNSIQNAQLNAILRGEQNFIRYEDLLFAARETKDLAKYAYLIHVEEHHCHEGDRRHAANPC
jgi:hypothetical protein